jgi:arsenite methyltransferase
MGSDLIYDRVQDRYGELADRSPTSEQKKTEQDIAQAFGYDAAELSSIPQAANLGVSCGNPVALANLREVSVTYTNPVMRQPNFCSRVKQ